MRMFRQTIYCPYSLKWQLEKWAIARWPKTPKSKYAKMTKKQLYALYYKEARKNIRNSG